MGRNAMPGQGILFILVGPSAAGKNTLMKRVQAQFADLRQLATATTRAIREGEQPGREHLFVTREEFQRLIDTGALIEYQPVHIGDLYGTPRQTVEDALAQDRDLIADIEFLGASKVYEVYPDNTVLIFVTPSSLHLLPERIRQRGNIKRGELEHRLARARFEMTFAPRCHYLILNDLLEPATEHLRQIIVSERDRRRHDAGHQAANLAMPIFHSAAIALLRHEDKLLMNSGGEELPTFPVSGATSLPHEILLRDLGQAVGQTIRIDAIADDRFDFVPPHYVTLAVIPRDAYVYYYYKCAPLTARPALMPGWLWRPVSELNLADAIVRLVESRRPRFPKFSGQISNIALNSTTRWKNRR
jgi:guanylate kinase